MAEQQEGKIYARAAILQWAAGILQSEYSSFSDIAAKDVAVLLHAIFNKPDVDGEGAVVSLHDIQFCENPTSTTRFLNAKRVLSLLQTLSSSTSDANCEGSASGGRLAPSVVGNMTASAWLEGKAFVEELKMWRWIRAEAFKRGLGKDELGSRAQAFLKGAVHSGSILSAGGRGLEIDNNPPEVLKSVVAKENTASSRKHPREEEEEKEEEALANATPGVAAAAMKKKTTADDKPRRVVESNPAIPTHSDSNVHTSRVVEAAVTQIPSDVSREEEWSATPLPEVTCDGVAAAPQLLGVLEKVKKELEEQRTAARDVATAPCGNESHVPEEARSDGRPPTGCASCPAVFAVAVQQNYDAIERLEAVRRLAVAACLKRDATAVLGALALV
ncbi:hypothetical protein DQ04_04671030 [Trypanosoma grayi]|uniref:hypothetical protein n=1 Tax=Trypanosoma grayi TaxID=71804 RepID=UPI0004F3FAD2|nr:hypothetical protein DQ04_04671030 [Trypanosoma grayi]KEG09775.1 hypothetical protein DQ04_04671030 [Trypanosoma grayi]